MNCYACSIYSVHTRSSVRKSREANACRRCVKITAKETFFFPFSFQTPRGSKKREKGRRWYNNIDNIFSRRKNIQFFSVIQPIFSFYRVTFYCVSYSFKQTVLWRKREIFKREILQLMDDAKERKNTPFFLLRFRRRR